MSKGKVVGTPNAQVPSNNVKMAEAARTAGAQAFGLWTSIGYWDLDLEHAFLAVFRRFEAAAAPFSLAVTAGPDIMLRELAFGCPLAVLCGIFALAFLDKLFSSPPQPDGPVLGHIAGCQLLEHLAEGPMSIVYRAVDSGGKTVCAKVLTSHGNRIAEKLSVKLKKPWEGERARALDHPNVVHTFECGKEKAQYYILMDYLGGGSFAEHLRIRTPEVMARRIDVLIAAANGLAYVHEKGIIHRDVCPKNLMFDNEGTIKLIDFGVAIHKHDRLKQTEVRTGRPSYLAPELIRYNRFDVQTDIYAFGVMLYETFAGQRPFLADSREELMNLHLRAKPVPPSRMDASIASEVDRVVLQALEKLPHKRYVDMRQLVTALVRLRGMVT